MTDIHQILTTFPNRSRDSLIPILQQVQEEHGFISEEAVNAISSYLNLAQSKIYGLATFYNQFRFSPPGKFHLRICNGTGCHLDGSGILIKEVKKQLGIGENETTRDGLFSLEVVSCIGACGMAPVISVNDRFYDRVDAEKLKQILKEYRETRE